MILIRSAPGILAALILPALLVGCNPRDKENLSSDTKELAQHAKQALGSATLAAKVNTALSLRKGVDMSGLKIEAEDGVVTLNGTVRDKNEHRLVVATVENTRGVDKVIDKLTLRPKP